MKQTEIFRVLALAMMVLISGCGKKAIRSAETHPMSEIQTSQAAIDLFEVGKSVNGEPMVIRVMSADGQKNNG